MNKLHGKEKTQKLKIMEQNKNLKYFAQSLRKAQTKEEGLLWYRFLSRYPIRFRRQYIIGNYIADFYCHQARLIVELDGSQHYEPSTQIYDRERSNYMESLGIKIIRFTNRDIHKRFPGVCEAIDIAVKECIASRTTSTPIRSNKENPG